MKYLTLIFLLLATTAYAEEIQWDDLVSAVIQVESKGNSNAISPCGAIGLMQITPIVLKEFNKNYIDEEHEFQTVPGSRGFYPMPAHPIDLKRGSCNIAIGTWYLHHLHDHYGCDTVEKIIMSYNAGITRCKSVNFNIKKLPKETQTYLKKVMTIYNKEN